MYHSSLYCTYPHLADILSEHYCCSYVKEIIAVDTCTSMQPFHSAVNVKMHFSRPC